MNIKVFATQFAGQMHTQQVHVRDLHDLSCKKTVNTYNMINVMLSNARTFLQGAVQGGRRQGRKRKKWEDNNKEWTGLEFGKSQWAVEDRKKMEETGCKIICGAPTTLAAVRGR